jgi:two-component system, OmpR family, sensor histidine kinase VanS
MADRTYKSNITKRLFYYILIIVLAFSLLILLANTLFLKPIYRYITKNSIEKTMDEVLEIDFSNDEEIWLSDLNNIESKNTFELIIFKNGRFFYSSSFQPRFFNRQGGKGPSAPRMNMQQMMSQSDLAFDQMMDSVLSGQQGKNFIVKEAIKGDFKFVITQFLEPMQKTIVRANMMLLMITFLFLFGGFIFTFRLSKSFTKPIKNIQSSVAKISNLDFSEKCEVNTNDELEHLATDINTLSNKLETTLNQLTHQNKQLENDIISQRKFISNASHELRTPLSLIKGYADEIDNGFVSDDNQKKSYINIISQEASKMSRLLREMLDLSRMESGRLDLKTENLSVKQQICDFIEKYDGYIIDNNLNVTLDFSGKKDIAVIDKVRFEQVLANYISNASKYCDDNRIIKIFTNIQEEKIRVSIFNSGENIEEDAIAHIWDRFYKNDNGDDEAEGSYGLGLSIVSAIQSLLGQKCGVKIVNGGVEFWFEVEKADN